MSSTRKRTFYCASPIASEWDSLFFPSFHTFCSFVIVALILTMYVHAFLSAFFQKRQQTFFPNNTIKKVDLIEENKAVNFE